MLCAKKYNSYNFPILLLTSQIGQVFVTNCMVLPLDVMMINASLSTLRWSIFDRQVIRRYWCAISSVVRQRPVASNHSLVTR